ncbi:NAD(P)/FAD-dependent oxidoreductase [Acanthopleuribacter pedis]|uniref:NAD(P)/FAD-dependent oxidoreductase n=1 Tax=Acanthopleuribacter pedis TaxID=442870 RepID=A0A8J7U6R7_9BACT|nr:NAD(P)/FAD-dependent oxidoreductase [Acanthopleuribacter pedis]MBO1321718.1 NAD(P)/FAD-dependent oxidoreductase [Acanthopleuribacter pedis]
MVDPAQKHLVIVGGGFAGLYAAKHLKNTNLRITLIDRRNFHLFQPLLYQVATGGLSPGDIAYPLRAVLKGNPRAHVIQDKVVDVLPDQKRVVLREGGELSFDYLLLATGVRHQYFGNEHWSDAAPGLKTIEDALEVRRRILSAFEEAERTEDPERRKYLLRFVIVGAGPTGVELAGALGELAHYTMRRNFRTIDPADAEVILVEGSDRVLPPYAPVLSAKAQRALEKLGVTVMSGTRVTDISSNTITLQRGDGEPESLAAGTVLWAAGVKATAFGRRVAEQTGAETDRAGRIKVTPELTIPGHPYIYVLGDLAHIEQKNGNLVPGVAPAAMQMGKYAAKAVAARLAGKEPAPFRYFDKGSMAVIGRNAAIAQIANLKLSGFPAWMIWAFIHIHFLIEFGNKMVVSMQWGWNYFTRKRGARLITGKFTPNPD